MKVLIVTMFFPPTGGGGVPRSLKFATYLSELGADVHVLTPHDAKWLDRDDTPTWPSEVNVVRIPNRGPSMRLLGPELYTARGLERLRVHARFAFRRALIPDQSVVWTVAAARAAVRLVRALRIDVVLTTSPPPSVNLVGATAKRLTGVRWVADVRDSIALNPHRRFDVRGERSIARLVARYSDAAVAASAGIAQELEVLTTPSRVSVIETGCDFDDFKGLSYRRSNRLRITHTGNFLGRRDPRPFLDALSRSPSDIVARFVGTVRQRDRDYAAALGLGGRIQVIPFSPHHETLAFQRDSDVLLLLVPEAAGRGRHVLTGKVFEYIAARRPILAAVPLDGEAAGLIARTGAGTVVPPNDSSALAAALRAFRERWLVDELGDVVLPPGVETSLSTRSSVRMLADVLDEVVGSPPVPM